MLIVGATGTGKSTLGRSLLEVYDQVVAIDPIHTLGSDLKGGKLPGYRLVTSPQQLPFAARFGHKLQYRPDPEYQNWEDYDRVFEWVFRRKNTMLYIDEGLRVMKGREASEWLNAILTAGRGRGIGCIVCTQRPTGIDMRMMSEAEHIICFRLRRLADRKRMAEQMGDVVVTHPARDHSFWHLTDQDAYPRYYTYVL